MCALSLGGLCQQPHKSLRAETCVAENWAEYSSGKFENRLVLKLSVCLWEIGIFCPNSLKSQMSKKSRVVKTYGRHKHRTVKAQIWLSPDENVHSPFGNGFPSKIEASSSKNVFKPKSSKWWDTSLLFLVKTASFYRGEMRTLIGANRWLTFSELYRPMVFCQVEFCDKTTFPS